MPGGTEGTVIDNSMTRTIRLIRMGMRRAPLVLLFIVVLMVDAVSIDGDTSLPLRAMGR